MQATLDLAVELNTEGRTSIAPWRIRDPRFTPRPSKKAGPSQHAVDTLPLPTKYLSAAEVLRFRDQAFRVYFNSPRYLDMINRTFGPETLQHIREMASHQLERRYA